MVDIFQIDMRDFARLTLFMKRAPFEFRRTTAGAINTIAFQAKKEIVKEIGRTMEVRSPKFVSSSVIVQPTRIRSISKQEAIVASIKRRGFSGWEEQETGKANEKKKVITQAARTGGSFSKKVRMKARMRPGRKFKTLRDFKSKKARTKGQMAFAMLKDTRTGKSKEPFAITGRLPGRMGRMAPGIYAKVGGKKMFFRLQTFDKKYKVERNKWMTKSIDRLTSKIDMRKLWAEQLNRIIDKGRRR